MSIKLINTLSFGFRVRQSAEGSSKKRHGGTVTPVHLGEDCKTGQRQSALQHPVGSGTNRPVFAMPFAV